MGSAETLVFLQSPDWCLRTKRLQYQLKVSQHWAGSVLVLFFFFSDFLLHEKDAEVRMRLNVMQNRERDRETVCFLSNTSTLFIGICILKIKIKNEVMGLQKQRAAQVAVTAKKGSRIACSSGKCIFFPMGMYFFSYVHFFLGLTAKQGAGGFLCTERD